MVVEQRSDSSITTSGNFRTPALLNTIQEVGADRLLFSADYPFEDMREAAEWFDRLEINDNDHIKIARTNAPSTAETLSTTSPRRDHGYQAAFSAER
ncbi:conserved hypothetical protein [Rhodococcus jostii RHA1]|jgi:2,3-dihydroxybenzoate decarboxylase|uniref:Amidohydrolase-related domain-containing protein n=1 Tax=Rhodococcus jostii (strain RHA1) TaxID=101510 RepID=Q0SBL9_RHOJR|nr:amidohydrolase family protein [Rhodococcus jostii]ABG95067.1 conserved hypothetical protein [Rhodococcus jostii RHA1]